MQKALSFNDVAIVYVKGKAYRIHFWYLGKDAINIMNGSNLIDKMGVLLNFFIIYKKWVNSIPLDAIPLKAIPLI